jgi:hypothetical protein
MTEEVQASTELLMNYSIKNSYNCSNVKERLEEMVKITEKFNYIYRRLHILY